VDDICVDEKARGHHVGTALFAHVKAFAREKGCYNITLHVWECNPVARSFYESLGMTPQFTSMELVCGRDD
jgi:ribosomal protein S18 acetylase RimI-like enzyme